MGAPVEQNIEALLKMREQARGQRNFAVADKIRDTLNNLILNVRAAIGTPPPPASPFLPLSPLTRHPLCW